MPIKPNYSFEKRQRELEKKKKKEEKAQKKAQAAHGGPRDEAPSGAPEAEAAQAGGPGF